MRRHGLSKLFLEEFHLLFYGQLNTRNYLHLGTNLVFVCQLSASSINIFSSTSPYGNRDMICFQSAYIRIDPLRTGLSEIWVPNGIVFYKVHLTWDVLAEFHQSIDCLLGIIYSVPNYIFVGNSSLCFLVPIF